MTKFKFSLAVVILMVSVCIFAGYPPNVQSTFKKMYPTAKEVNWSQDGNYFIAGFMVNGFEKNVWFDTKAHWIMTQTGIETVDGLAPAIYNAFSFGQYSDWQVTNVTLVEFLKCPTVAVVQVSQYNIDTSYLLFYASDGTLLYTLNANDTNSTLQPDFFNCE